MTYEKFNEIRSSLKLTSTEPLQALVTADHSWFCKKTGLESYKFKKGEYVSYFFSEKYPGTIFLLGTDRVCLSKCRLASKFLAGFRKCPTLRTLERWSNDGIARSVLNQKVEPDGWDQFGSPSWLLVYGII